VYEGTTVSQEAFNLDRWLRDTRGYGLGERNPSTLPDGTKGSEKVEDNLVASERWEMIRKLTEQGSRFPRWL
jgi:hypothetical protein